MKHKTKEGQSRQEQAPLHSPNSTKERIMRWLVYPII